MDPLFKSVFFTPYCMKLLIITQKVDREDPVLGFMLGLAQ
jgi:hypothetical protein